MKFVAQLVDPVIKDDHVVLKFRASADQLPRVIQLATLTGAGNPQPFTLKVVAKDSPGFGSTNAVLKSLNIREDGDTRVVILAGGFDIGALGTLVGDKNVAVAVIKD